MFYLFTFSPGRTVNINAKHSVLNASIHSVREMRRKIFIVYNMIVENLVEFIGHCSLLGKCYDDSTNGASECVQLFERMGAVDVNTIESAHSLKQLSIILIRNLAHEYFAIALFRIVST